MDKYKIEAQYQRWLERAAADPDIVQELADMAEDEGKKEDAFYRDLAFGTGGLRGVIGCLLYTSGLEGALPGMMNAIFVSG